MTRHTFIHRLVTGATVLVMLGAAQSVVADADRTSRSETVAGELARRMAHAKLDAYAVRDPDAPNSFIAALLFPGVQLLVVCGQPTSPTAVESLLNQKQYADVYAMLHQAVVPGSKIFFQDLNADGLHAKAPGAPDIVYEHVTTQLVFDGAPAKRHFTDAQYEEQFAAADARYERLLSVLLDGLKSASVQ